MINEIHYCNVFRLAILSFINKMTSYNSRYNSVVQEQEWLCDEIQLQLSRLVKMIYIDPVQVTQVIKLCMNLRTWHESPNRTILSIALLRGSISFPTPFPVKEIAFQNKYTQIKSMKCIKHFCSVETHTNTQGHRIDRTKLKQSFSSSTSLDSYH